MGAHCNCSWAALLPEAAAACCDPPALHDANACYQGYWGAHWVDHLRDGKTFRSLATRRVRGGAVREEQRS
jgi:hypothetical protein